MSWSWHPLAPDAHRDLVLEMCRVLDEGMLDLRMGDLETDGFWNGPVGNVEFSDDGSGFGTGDFDESRIADFHNRGFGNGEFI